MKWFCTLICLAFLTAQSPVAFAGKNDTVQTIRVKIEANQWDKDLILQKLNQHGQSHHLKFEAADDGYQYRVTFATGQKRNVLLEIMGAGAVNYSKADVTVYDSKGVALFQFERDNRYTDSGATNAAAKEIIKRLVKLRSRSGI
ncbi:MAG TPA: hypothetical protein VMV59_05080 [Candidatus Dormibacteraeota bacterium]|nr:hypothetical protein [Candidatus Dormibacteraeota bacterium]